MDNNTLKLVCALKEILKNRNIPYRDLCQPLNLSESSIKRLFSKMTFSLDQIIIICHFLSLSLTDLSQAAFDEADIGHKYTVDQDRLFGENPLAAYVYVRLLVGFNLKEVQEELNLTRLQILRIARLLDKVRLIDFLPHEKVKVIVKGPFQHVPNGHYEKTFLPRTMKIVTQHFNKLSRRLHDRDPSERSRAKGLVHLREFYLTEEVFESFKKELMELSQKYRRKNNTLILQNGVGFLKPVCVLLGLDYYNYFKENIFYSEDKTL